MYFCEKRELNCLKKTNFAEINLHYTYGFK